MLKRDDTVFVLVDLQEKLIPAIHERTKLVGSISRLVRGMAALDIPMLWAEQNPDGLGPTVPEIAALMPGEAISKLSFSCCGEPRFVSALGAVGRRQVVLAGIEAHVCVQQTAADLLADDYEVHVVADAVSSRTPENKGIGLDRARDEGALITSVECALFELLGVAEGAEFKEILKIVK